MNRASLMPRLPGTIFSSPEIAVKAAIVPPARMEISTEKARKDRYMLKLVTAKKKRLRHTSFVMVRRSSLIFCHSLITFIIYPADVMSSFLRLCPIRRKRSEAENVMILTAESIPPNGITRNTAASANIMILIIFAIAIEAMNELYRNLSNFFR